MMIASFSLQLVMWLIVIAVVMPAAAAASWRHDDAQRNRIDDTLQVPPCLPPA